MFAVSLVAFTLAAFLILDTVVRKTDFFSPARLYLFFHALTLGIAFLALDKAMTPFRPMTSLVYFGSAACFLSGVWAAGLLIGRNQSTVRLPDMERYNWNLHFGFAFALFFVFGAGMLIAFLGIGTFPLLAEDKAKAIWDFFNVSWSASVGLSYGGVTMALFFISIFRPRNGSWILNVGLWMTVLSALIFSLALSRSGLIFFAFFALVFYHHAVRRLSIARLFLMFLLFFSLFLTTAYLKLSNFQKENDLKFDVSTIALPLLRIPYNYVANNFWNLDYALNPENFQERHPTTYGFTTLSGIVDMMNLPGGALGVNIRESARFDDQFHAHAAKVRGLNTVGYQWGLYKDFGLAGVFICPFLFGTLFGVLYARMRSHPTVFNLAVYSYLAYFVGLSWFLAFWESLIYIYGLAYVCLCCYLCQYAFPKVFAFKRKAVRSDIIAGT